MSEPSLTILEGDCLQSLRSLPSDSVHCCVTSPPYWGLRDYGAEGQYGQEATPEEYVENMVQVFREVRRVLRPDGVLWLNLGDSYAGSWGNQGRKESRGSQRSVNGEMIQSFAGYGGLDKRTKTGSWVNNHPVLKPKDLIGIPWRVAFALQADGWYLRSDIIWSKPNPMPESVTDRPTKAHEYIFLMTKNEDYFYDYIRIKEPVAETTKKRLSQATLEQQQQGSTRVPGKTNGNMKAVGDAELRNRRTVWTVTTKPYKGAHFATFPPDLIEPCVLATSEHGCCARCLAPYKRVVKKVKGVPPSFAGSRFDTGKTAAGREHLSAVGTGERTVSTTTIGWESTCGCGADIDHCTILDPFGGSGTTGQVALKHGRHAILCELNPEYIKLILERCGATLESEVVA